MAKINGNDIRPGMVIEYDGSRRVAVKTVAVKPGKDPACNQVELKNIIDGRKLNQRFSSDARVEQLHVERKDFRFLYRQGDQFVFMNTDTYEQIELDFVGERTAFLQDGMTVNVQMHQDRAHRNSLAGARRTRSLGSGRRPQGTERRLILQAGSANGLRLMVPPFITAGEKVVVNTNEVSYVRRAE
jgi:elongation factor P